MLTAPKKKVAEHWLDFLVTLTQKELKARYKHTVAGFLWSFVNPVLQMLVIGLVFQHFIPHASNNYFLFLFAGLLPWNFFSSTLAKTTPAFFFERYLIQKAKFPKEIIVLSIVLSNFVNFLVSSGILAIAAVIVFGVPTLSLLFLIPTTLWLLLLAVGVSLLTASLNVRYRDVQFFVQAALPLWFYATPIVYSLDFVPQSLRRILVFNPLYWVVDSYHRVMIDGVSPFSALHIQSFSIGLGIVLLGWIVYQHMHKNFDDWL